jgi:hypothetical protein
MTDPKRPAGRPPIYDAPATIVLQVRVTSAQRLELRRVAAQRGTDVSGILREFIHEHVEDRRPGPRVFRLVEPDE